MSPRAQVAACYDHLSGLAGERLTRRFIEQGWVTPDPEPGVTPIGWQGFAQLGLDLTPLTASRRKPVAYCTERAGVARHEHLGGHLGALIRQHFLHQAWLRVVDGELVLTAEGERALQDLGIRLEETL